MPAPVVNAQWHRSRGWMRKLRAGGTVQLSSSSFRSWMLHAEYNSSSKCARALNVLLGLIFVGLSVSMEYGVGAETSYVYSTATVHKRFGLSSFTVPYTMGLEYDHIQIYLSRTKCKGRGIASEKQQLCEAGHEDRRIMFRPDFSFLNFSWPSTKIVDLGDGHPSGRINIGQKTSTPYFIRTANCVCGKFKGYCACVEGHNINAAV
eukprot:IDg18905t1